MKKITLVVSALLAAVLIFAAVSPVMAAGPQQGGPGNGDPEEWGGDSPRRGARRAGAGMYLNQNLKMEIQMDGLLEEIIHSQLAEALGIDLNILNERLEAGESMVDLAADQGYDQAAFSEMMVEARITALQEAVESGILSQEQVDWISTRGFINPELGSREGCLTD